MKKVLLSVAGLLLSTMMTSGQQRIAKPGNHVSGMKPVVHRTCATGELDHAYEQWLQPLIRETEQRNAANRGAATVYNIPVVFHVIHNGSNPGISYNITDAQILSQLAVLNEDFRKLNADTSLIPTVFKPASADCEINFCMAQTAPNGSATTGIDRINRNTVGWTAPPYTKTYIDGTIKPASIWNPNNYLNIWVVPDYTDQGFQILGHATFPSGSTLPGLTGNFGTATTDGVVIWYKSCGRVGNLDPTYDEGRTATHEIGHWLGLRHIWGDANCGTDYCNDTPTQQSANFGCPVYPSVSGCTGSAPNGDMFMNFMDYCDDPCLYMFTTNQKTRVQTVMANSPLRVALAQSTACNPPVVAAPVADFSASATNISVGGSVNFTDLSSNAPTGWAWTFNGGTPGTSSQQNPQNIVYNAAGTYTVTLVATNGSGSDTETKVGYITVTAGAGSCDTITNYDFVNHTFTILGSSGWGYVSGQNDYGDVAKGDKYTVSGTNQTVDGAFFAFGVGSSSGTGQTVNVRVWDDNGTSGLPNTVLGTQTLSYDSIAAGALAGSLTWVDFVPNIPVSGDIYVGVEFGYTANDTLAIIHCADGEITTGTAYEKWSNNSWHPYSELNTGWGINVAHVILPVICPLVGISEQEASFKMLLYPNPAKTSLNVVIPQQNSRGQVSFRVLNMLGAEVSAESQSFVTSGMYKLDITTLSQGFYFLEVQTDYGRRVEKFQVA
ncbi:MAG: PKD domain-containing protein, partial [Bacteroidia bacterium]|nr:PKD domain-containing protein [Bacteroidia bacterium]